MKRTLLLALILLSVITASAQSYSVRGTVNAGNDGKTIYLANYKGGAWAKTDSAKIQDNRFVINGKTESPQVIYLLTYNGDKEIFSDFILENEIIAINATIGETLDITAMGTSANNGYAQYKEALAQYKEQVAPIRKQLEDPNLDRTKFDSLRTEMYAHGDKLEEDMQKIMEDNSDNYVGLMFMQNFYSRWTTERTKAFLAKVPEDLRTTDIYKKVNEHVTVMENTAEGKKFTDIVGNTPEGKEIKLSDYAGKGKLVLVDFWASWCGPCMMEMPNVIKAYNDFKDKGFEIVGVSLDSKSDAWRKALVEQKMTWPQLSDLQGWKAAGAAAYGVRAIPATVLIDKDGTIIARGLRGSELISKIAEILK